MRLFLIIILLTAGACSPTPPSSQGYWIDERPYRGTLRANRTITRPYWQCVDGVKNIECRD